VDEVSVRRGNPYTPCVAAFVGEGLADKIGICSPQL
jgi:hypothetical protein